MRSTSERSGGSAQSNKWVIVRVWLPKDKDGNLVTCHDSKSVTPGHTSLQTKDLHASHWPKENSLGKIATHLATDDAVNHNCYEDDRKREAGKDDRPRDADVVVVLYSLDVQAIKNEFERQKSLGILNKWGLHGRNTFNTIKSVFSMGQEGQSCSGLVYDLLNAGGIKNIVNWDTVSSWWVVAPDAVARVAALAADNQREKALGSISALPPGINARVTKPKNLDPHESSMGSALALPSMSSSSRP